MTSVTIDPRTALLIIDLQQGIVARETVHPSQEIVAQCEKLASAFRAAKLPVVLINVVSVPAGRTQDPRPDVAKLAEGSALVPELHAQPSDLRITKLQWGAFHGTSLDVELRRRGVTQLILGGIATSAGVESTARAAWEHGYSITFACDAITDMQESAHRNSMESILPRIGELASTDAIVSALRTR